MRRPVAPCKDCEDRFLGCHSLCDKYIRFNHQCELLRKEKHRIAEETRVLNEIEKRRIHLAMSGNLRRRKK